MSRIAGIFFHEGAPDATRIVKRILRQTAPHALGRETVIAMGPAALGHWGWGSTNAVATGPVLVAIDGCLYNRRELGEAASDPELLAGLYERHGFVATLPKLNGDFSIALFDSARNDL